MFDGVLYFILGFLASALLALMVSPAIWNRAVVLTKRRIESSVPLTLNEVQADKDQLRAEFAMSTRRLELSIEELQEKAAQQLIEINKKRDELTKLSAESQEKVHAVQGLETQSSEIRARLNEREDALAKTTKELNATREKLEASALELETMRRTVSETKADADSKRIELVAKQTNLDNFSAEKSELQSQITALSSEKTSLASELASARLQISDGEERLLRLQKTQQNLEEKLAKRERNLSEIRSSNTAETESNSELTRLLMDERKKTTQLEGKLAKAVLRTEALLSDASNENVKKAMQTLSADKASLADKVKSLKAENKKLEAEVLAYRNNSSQEWETERKENAVLRERINDLAAQVTAMTAAIEGPDSPINDILKSTEKVNSKSKTRKTAASQSESLADRVRALQESARKKQA